ncbi:DUF7522 family protein [Halobacterium litoreum]|uniref:Uncharacterized protein n=1 Tax=Halobacterium litoreum TaxID=2039234 RepID=A0ABD5NFX2_9EURY|nr:hypothetical protein [Halobacterium litoreum]UHH12926.1 hypothetical protein LT972_12255 [Halobacterium litoreum]
MPESQTGRSGIDTSTENDIVTVSIPAGAELDEDETESINAEFFNAVREPDVSAALTVLRNENALSGRVFERTGFAEGPVRTAIADRAGDSDIGPYEFTVRFHRDGFVVRVIQGDAGVLFTTDAMNVDAFEDAATAIRGLLADARRASE